MALHYIPKMKTSPSLFAFTSLSHLSQWVCHDIYFIFLITCKLVTCRKKQTYMCSHSQTLTRDFINFTLRANMWGECTLFVFRLNRSRVNERVFGNQARQLFSLFSHYWIKSRLGYAFKHLIHLQYHCIDWTIAFIYLSICTSMHACWCFFFVFLWKIRYFFFGCWNFHDVERLPTLEHINASQSMLTLCLI